MFDRTKVFDAGEQYSEELRYLIRNPELLSSEEKAMLLAQIDSIWDQIERLANSRRLPNWPYVALGRLLSGEGLEAMTRQGTNPLIVRAVRNRRYRAFCRHLEAARSQFASDSRRAGTRCAGARAWLTFLREMLRRIEGESLFTRLLISAMLYRAGMRVSTRRMVERLQGLAAGLPDHAQ